MKIRPRIFLEGNFFVDLQPGSPGADDARVRRDDRHGPDRRPGAVRPGADARSSRTCAATSSPCSRATAARSTTTRRRARTRRTTPTPTPRGENAAKSLNDSLDYSGEALRGTALVNQALLGTEPHDLSKLIAGCAEDVGQARLARGPAQGPDHQLQHDDRGVRGRARQPAPDDRAAAARARRARTRRSTRSTARSRRRARSPARSCPASARPRPRSTPSFPWIEQTRALVSPAELQGLVADLRPAVADLSSLTDDTIELLPQVDLVNRCATNVLLPTGDIKIEDGFLTTGKENYKEFWQAMVGLSGEAQNFDGNGSYVRFQTGGGLNTLSTGPSGFDTRPGQRRAAVRQLHAAADRHAPGAPGRQAAGQPQGAVLHSRRSRTSTPRRWGWVREARDQKAPARLHRDPACCSSSGSAWPPTSRRTSGCTCPAWVPGRRHGLLRGRGRVLDRAGRRAGPGPDGRHRRRPGRRDRRGQPARTASPS